MLPGDREAYACNARDLGLMPGEMNGYPLQYSCLENSVDRGDWSATVHGVAKSWTIMKAECRRIDAFELWCWRTLESPLDCKQSNQSILKEISPGCSLEGMMLKLKVQYFGHLTGKASDAGRD